MDKRLQVLIPQYKETDDIIRPLLDSIALQQSIDFNEIGLIICNDGSDVFLSDEFLKSYPFQIDYYKEPHKGVSATRNFCLDHSTSEYVMFCDADDMFFSALGLWQIFQEMQKGFDTLFSDFYQEIKDSEAGNISYEFREKDGIFVHGKVHRRQYLVDNDIRFNEKLSINEDSYFIALCQSLTKDICYISIPFYIWKWRDGSVSHNDPQYEFIAYEHMLDSNDALVNELLNREVIDKARMYVEQMTMDVYYTLMDPEWSRECDSDIDKRVRERFRLWLKKYKPIWDSASIDERTDILYELSGSLQRNDARKEIYSINKWIGREIL